MEKINESLPMLDKIDKQEYKKEVIAKEAPVARVGEAFAPSFAPKLPPPGKGKYAKARMFYVDTADKPKKFPKVKFFKNGRKWMLLFGDT